MSDLRELRADIRHWRRGRSTLSWGEAFTDAYVAVFTGLVAGSMLVSALVGVGGLARDACTGGPCLVARLLVPWAWAAASALAALTVARMFGPIFVTPAESRWLLTAPVDRRGLLGPRLLIVLASSAAAVAVSGAVGFLVAGQSVTTTLLGAAASALAATAAVAVAARRQASGGRPAHALTALGMAVVVALLAVPALGVRSLPGWASYPWGWGVLLLLPATVAACVLAWRALPAARRHHLTPGGELAPSLSGALASLELPLVYDVLLGHRWRRRGSVTIRRGFARRAQGTAALGRSEAVRLGRAPSRLLPLAFAVLAVYACLEARAGHLVLLVAGLVGFLATLPLLGGLRVLARGESVARLLPWPPTTARRTALIVPALVLFFFGLLIAPALRSGADSDPTTTAALTGAVCLIALASATRWMTAPPPNYQGPMVSSPAGAVPTTLIGAVLRGFDVWLVASIPMLLFPTVHGALASAAAAGAALAWFTADHD